MRLLKASTITLVEFPPDRIPIYAILSHTWDDDEVMFADMEHQMAREMRKAWPKVELTCKQALADGFEYVWIDTCCIDKSSSAELSEAINSMFAWYAQAATCYAYLADVPAKTELGVEFEQSRWFTRGFTLQELLAPQKVIFFSNDWTRLGEKSTLAGTLERITSIHQDVLLHTTSLESTSIAIRMSWAALRETSRPEDKAYCLMGVFSVSMPMLYGEGGEKAFLRLQEEIMKQSDDQTIFAWTSENESPTRLHGLLASSPSQFAACQNIIPYKNWEARQPYSMTNRGLRIELSMSPYTADTFLAALYCPVPGIDEKTSFLAVTLKKLSPFGDQYARVGIGQLARVRRPGPMQTVFIPQKVPEEKEPGPVLHHTFYLGQLPSAERYPIMKIASSGIVKKATKGDPAFHAFPGAQCAITCAVYDDSDEVFCFIFLERHYFPEMSGILVMLGSSRFFGIGFDAVQLPSIKKYASMSCDELRHEFQRRFNPRKTGKTLGLVSSGYGQVSVLVELVKHPTPKQYTVNMKIDGETDIHIKKQEEKNREKMEKREKKEKKKREKEGSFMGLF